MRPGQTGEVEKDRLRILDLSRRDGDGFGRFDLVRRVDLEGRHLGAWMRGRGRDFQGGSPGLEDRHDDLVLHLIDPKGGGHLGRVCVGVRARGAALKEGDVGGSAAQLGGSGARGDGEDGRLCDGLSVVGPAQHVVGIVQHGLGNGARRDKFAEVLRQSCRVRGGRGLAGEANLVAGAADDEWGHVYRWDDRRACEAGGGR